MFFDFDTISLYYEKYGTGKKSIVILPGWGDTRKTFDGIIDLLSNDFTVYILDYPGFGNTKFPNKNMTIFDYSNLIYAWITHLELTDPIIIGHSFGGRIAITLTGYYRYSFSKIILINSAGIKPKKTILKTARSIVYKTLQKISKFIPNKYRVKYKEAIFNYFSSDDYKTLGENMRKTFQNIVNEDLRPYLKDIASDVLLIWGEKDLSTPKRDAVTMNSEINNSGLVILKNTGHFSYLEQPQLVKSILIEALTEDIIK